MKIKTYLAALQKLAKKYPNAEVVSSSDDEGNSFQSVNYIPTYGKFESEGDGFGHGDFGGDTGVDAICVN